MACLKRIISGFLAITIIFSLSVSALAFDVGTAIEGLGVIGTFADVALNLYDRWKEAHPNTPDSEYPGFNPGGMYGGGVGRDELNQKYDDYVQTLPAPSYTSDGSILWSPEVSYAYIFFNDYRQFCPHYTGSYDKLLDSCISVFDCANKTLLVRPVAGSNSFLQPYFELHFSGNYPIDGYYKQTKSLASNFSYIDSSTTKTDSFFYDAD